MQMIHIFILLLMLVTVLSLMNHKCYMLCPLWAPDLEIYSILFYSPHPLLVKVQCFRKGLYKAVKGQSTRPIVLSMINESYCRRRRRLTIFEPDNMKFGVSLTLLSL